MENKICGNKNQKNYDVDAISHAKLGLSSTLFLAYRDLSKLLDKYLDTKSHTPIRVLDFGCGAGLSTRVIYQLLRSKGLEVDMVGMDINQSNIQLAKDLLPNTNFCLTERIGDQQFDKKFDLIICNFVLLENTKPVIEDILKYLRSQLEYRGIVICTGTSKKIYNPKFRWISLNNNFVENNDGQLNDGQSVVLAVKDSSHGHELFRFHDFFFKRKTYKSIYDKCGFNLLETHKPLGDASDDLPWLSEMEQSPYKIDILSIK